MFFFNDQKVSGSFRVTFTHQGVLVSHFDLALRFLVGRHFVKVGRLFGGLQQMALVNVNVNVRTVVVVTVVVCSGRGQQVSASRHFYDEWFDGRL